MDRTPKPYSPWRQIVTLLLFLAVINAFAVGNGDRRIALSFDVGFATLMAAAFVASRLWPDKIWFRRPGEPTWLERTREKKKAP